MEKQKYIKLLDELILILENKHLDFYFQKSKEEIEKLKKDILNQYPLEDDYDFYYLANYLIKHIVGNYDEHTSLQINQNLQEELPLEIKIFNNEVYVINCPTSINDLKFHKLTAINGINISQILSEIEEITNYSTKGWLEVMCEDYLMSGGKIRALPSIKNNNDLIFTIGDKDINITAMNDKIKREYLIDKNMTYELVDNVIKINYHQCYEIKEGQMETLINDLKNIASQNNISKYIVDLRGNTGGSSAIIKPLIDFLKGNEIITLTDKYIFSSGLMACKSLKDIGSKFIGDNVGSQYNEFGDSKMCTLDDFIIEYSHKYFYYDDTDNKIHSISDKKEFEKFKSDKSNEKFFHKHYFQIDNIITPSLDDYILKKDPIFECAKSNIVSNYKKI